MIDSTKTQELRVVFNEIINALKQHFIFKREPNTNNCSNVLYTELCDPALDARYSLSLSIQAYHNGTKFGSKIEHNEAGDEYYVYDSIHFSLNWAAFGEVDSALAHQVLTFYNDVAFKCVVLSKIYSHLENVASLGATREQIVEREAQECRLENHHKVVQYVINNVGNIRVNTTRTYHVVDSTQVACGEYEVNLPKGRDGVKTYKCIVNGNDLIVTRTY